MVLLVVNWVVSSLLLGPAPREKVSYTFFLTQVDARNIVEITSTGDRIEGVFKSKVADPADGKNAANVDRFTTQRPSFAEDDLFRKLQDAGVPVNANDPDQPCPVVAADPGRVRSDAAVRGPAGVVLAPCRGGRPGRHRPVPGEAVPAGPGGTDHVRRRRRHRRG